MMRPPLAIEDFRGKHAAASVLSEGMVTESISDANLCFTCPIIPFASRLPLLRHVNLRPICCKCWSGEP